MPFLKNLLQVYYKESEVRNAKKDLLLYIQSHLCQRSGLNTCTSHSELQQSPRKHTNGIEEESPILLLCLYTPHCDPQVFIHGTKAAQGPRNRSF